MKLNKTIEELKNKLVKTHKEYHNQIFNILNDIYQIRIKKNKNYTIMDLSKESTICDMFDYHYISTIMNIRLITKKTMNHIDNGDYTLFEVANNLRKSRKLHNPKEQDKFFDENIDYNSKEIRDNVVILNNGLKNRMSEENAWILDTVYKIRSIKRIIMDRFIKLSQGNKNKVKKEIIDLYNFINNKYDKNYSLVFVHKNTLEQLRLIKVKGITGTNEHRIARIVDKFCTDDIITCKSCKKPFKKNRKDQVYCSVKCRKKENNKVNKK